MSRDHEPMPGQFSAEAARPTQWHAEPRPLGGVDTPRSRAAKRWLRAALIAVLAMMLLLTVIAAMIG